MLQAYFVPNVQIEEVNMNKQPTQVFILTKEYSPRDSQDDKILPKHFEINLKIEYPFRNKRE